MVIDKSKNLLTARISNCVPRAQFADFFGRLVDSPTVRRIYEARQHGPLTSIKEIIVPQPELNALVSELEGSLGAFKSADSDSVGNGLYLLMGTSGSPRLPSVEDYAKILVLAAARIGTARVVGLFSAWQQGALVPSRSCALLKGIETERALEPVKGMRLETLPPNPGFRSTSMRIDEYGTPRDDDLDNHVMLTLKYETICGLYDPTSYRESFPHHLPRRPVNPELKALTFQRFCSAMSLEVNGYVDWFEQWNDYADVEAFSLQPNFSRFTRDIHSRSAKPVSEDLVVGCLRTDANLGRFQNELALPVARWLRSTRSPSAHEQLVELRIALESLFLPNDHEGEKSFRLAVRGARFLTENHQERKTYFKALRSVYARASAVIHGGPLKEKKGQEIAGEIAQVQDICRDAILRIARAEKMPDWSEVVLGG